MKMTTLCYIEKDGKYLMLHRTKKEKDINKDKWCWRTCRGRRRTGGMSVKRSKGGDRAFSYFLPVSRNCYFCQ